MSMNREQFLKRVSGALGRRSAGSSVPPPPVVRDDVVRLVGPGDAVIGIFIQRAEAVGMHVHRATVATAGDELARLLGELSIKSVVASSQLAGFDHVLQQAGVESVDWRGDRTMAGHYDADAGINDAEAAFADSGTLVVKGDATGGRGLYLVPKVHIAILRADDVQPDQLDYMKALRDVPPGQLPAGRTFITGPSKTADIEGVLVTGVHGPGAVHILLIED